MFLIPILPPSLLDSNTDLSSAVRFFCLMCYFCNIISFSLSCFPSSKFPASFYFEHYCSSAGSYQPHFRRRMVPRSLPFLFLLSLPLISCHPNPSLFDGLYADPLDDVHAWSPGTHRPPSASTHFAPRDDEKKRMKKSLLGKAWTGHASTLVNAGETGVSAM